MIEAADALKTLDLLVSKDASRECVNRVERGIDRVDVDILRTAFHPDAHIQWGTPEPLPLDKWLGSIDYVRQITRQAQHMIGNMLIELDGDMANVETYELSRHLTKMGEEWKDLIYSARYLDRFSRRDGEWRIGFRVKIMDWMRVMEGSDGSFDDVPIKGSRDANDLSYQMFGEKVFTGVL